MCKGLLTQTGLNPASCLSLPCFLQAFRPHPFHARGFPLDPGHSFWAPSLPLGFPIFTPIMHLFVVLVLRLRLSPSPWAPSFPILPFPFPRPSFWLVFAGPASNLLPPRRPPSNTGSSLAHPNSPHIHSLTHTYSNPPSSFHFLPFFQPSILPPPNLNSPLPSTNHN